MILGRTWEVEPSPVRGTRGGRWALKAMVKSVEFMLWTVRQFEQVSEIDARLWRMEEKQHSEVKM